MIDLLYNPYSIVLMITSLLMTMLGCYSIICGYSKGSHIFAMLFLAVAFWCFFHAFEVASSAAGDKVLWANIQFISILSVPVLWFLFTLRYLGYLENKIKKTAAFLFIPPCVFFILIITNGSHHIMFTRIAIIGKGAYLFMFRTFGYGFWVMAAYSYVLMLGGIALLTWALFRMPNIYKGQLKVVIIGAVAPLVGNIAYISGLTPFPHLDLTPIIFSFSVLVMFFGIFRYRFLNMMPVTYDTVVNSIDDAIFIMDEHNRIMDANPAAEALLRKKKGEMLLKKSEAVLTDWPEVVKTPVMKLHQEIQINLGEKNHMFELKIVPIEKNKKKTFPANVKIGGKVVMLRDITHLKAARTEKLYREKLESVLETAGAVCHELNQPMQCILGYAELLAMDENLRPATLDKLQKLQKNIEKMGGITLKLSQITKYETRDYSNGRRIIDIDRASDYPGKVGQDSVCED